MNFKKTLIISVLFHIVLFSAALLFSAGLFKGSGNNPDEKVFFVKLSVENSKADSIKLVSKKKAFAPAKVQARKQEEKNLVDEKPPEIVTSEDALEKVPELSEEKISDHNDPMQTDTEEANADEEPLPDDVPDSSENQRETVNASQLASVESKVPGNGSARSGLSPSMLELIGKAIENVKSYPMLARKRGMEGTVHVSFRINESGRPDEIEIKKSSGHSILDSATVKVVKKAAPYPHTNTRVEVPVAYRLRK